MENKKYSINAVKIEVKDINLKELIDEKSFNILSEEENDTEFNKILSDLLVYYFSKLDVEFNEVEIDEDNYEDITIFKVSDFYENDKYLIIEFSNFFYTVIEYINE